MFKYTYLKNTFFLLFVYTKTPFELKMYTRFYEAWNVSCENISKKRIKYQKLM